MEPTGDLPVGVAEFEYVANGFSMAPTAKIDPRQHVVGRLFYPCDPDQPAGSGRVQTSSPWIPSFKYATGYASFLFFLSKSWAAAVPRNVLKLCAYAVGRTQKQPFHQGAAMAAGGGPHPVVLFSHGLGGCRNTYSVFCAELASQGYVVLALEHADGTASTCKLAGSGGHRYYAGLGVEEAKWGKQRFRTVEAQSAARVLRAASAGTGVDGSIMLSGVPDPESFLEGTLDTHRFAIAGHSFGGATCGELCAADPSFVCGIALDPWWHGLTPESGALARWRSNSPLMILGSHDWNTPGDDGDIKAGGKKQAAVLAAAQPSTEGGESLGGGALLLVLANSTHDTYNDILPLFATRLSWLLKKMKFEVKLDPEEGMNAVTQCARAFLAEHMPARPQSAGGPLPASSESESLPAEGVVYADSEWSLVSAGSHDEAEPGDRPAPAPGHAVAVGASPEATPEAAGAPTVNGYIDGQPPVAETRTSSSKLVEGAEAAAIGDGSIGLAAEEAVKAAQSQPAAGKPAGGKPFSLVPSSTEVTAMSQGAQSGSGHVSAQLLPWQTAMQTAPGEAGPERAKVPLRKEEEAVFRRLVGPLAHIVEVAV